MSLSHVITTPTHRAAARIAAWQKCWQSPVGKVCRALAPRKSHRVAERMIQRLFLKSMGIDGCPFLKKNPQLVLDEINSHLSALRPLLHEPQCSHLIDCYWRRKLYPWHVIGMYGSHMIPLAFIIGTCFLKPRFKLEIRPLVANRSWVWGSTWSQTLALRKSLQQLFCEEHPEIARSGLLINFRHVKVCGQIYKMRNPQFEPHFIEKIMIKLKMLKQSMHVQNFQLLDTQATGRPDSSVTRTKWVAAELSVWAAGQSSLFCMLALILALGNHKKSRDQKIKIWIKQIESQVMDVVYYFILFFFLKNTF